MNQADSENEEQDSHEEDETESEGEQTQQKGSSATELQKRRHSHTSEEDLVSSPEDVPTEATTTPSGDHDNQTLVENDEVTDLTMDAFPLYRPSSTHRKKGKGNHTVWTVSAKDKQYIESINNQIPGDTERYHIGPYEVTFAAVMTPGDRFPKRQWKAGMHTLTANNGHVDLTYDADSYRHMGTYLLTELQCNLVLFRVLHEPPTRFTCFENRAQICNYC